MFGEPVSYGGQEAFAANVISRLDGRGAVFDALTPYYCDNEKYARMITCGGEMHCLSLPFRPGSNRFDLIKPLRAFLAGHKYDVIHIHSGSISVLAEGASEAARAGIKKIIVHSHCAAEKETLKHRLIKAAFAYPMGKATDYIACSMKAGLSKFSAAVCRKKLVILKNGVDLGKFRFSSEVRAEMRGRLGLDGGCLLLGHVGRFSYQKNHGYLLEVLKRIKARGADCRLLLIGSGEELDSVRKKSREDGTESSIIYAGNVDNVEDYMCAMDVFLLPSRYEGLPIVGVEAQAAGLPCIFSSAVTDEAGLTPHVTYLGITPDDADKWADAAIAYAGTRGTAEGLAENGFDIADTAEKLWKIYTE